MKHRFFGEIVKSLLKSVNLILKIKLSLYLELKTGTGQLNLKSNQMEDTVIIAHFISCWEWVTYYLALISVALFDIK